MNIRTYYSAKPVPTNKFDWEAVDYDTLDEDSIVGFGATKEAAIADLLEQIEEAS